MAAAATAAGSASAVSRPLPDRPAVPRGTSPPPRDPRGDRVRVRGLEWAFPLRRRLPAPHRRPCVWRGPELRAAPELWTHRLTASEIAELDAALRARAPTWT